MRKRLLFIFIFILVLSALNLGIFWVLIGKADEQCLSNLEDRVEINDSAIRELRELVEKSQESINSNQQINNAEFQYLKSEMLMAKRMAKCNLKLREKLKNGR